MKTIEAHDLGKVYDNGVLLVQGAQLVERILPAADCLLVVRVGPRFERARIISSL